MAWNDDLKPPHRDVAAYPDSPLRVLAGPGTGKTFVVIPTLSHYRQISSGRWHDLKPFGKQNQDQAPEWVVNLTK